MSQSSPEGIILGKGSKIVSAEVSINDEKRFSLNQEAKFSEEEVKIAFRTGFIIGYGTNVHDIDERNKTCEEWFEKFKKMKR